jgi:hypothetical protein
LQKKLKGERCTAICLCPDWEKEWVRKLFRLVTKKFRFEEGTELFEVNGKPMEGIRWGVWALLVEGGEIAKYTAQGVENDFPHGELHNIVTLNARMLKEKYPGRGGTESWKGKAIVVENGR